MKDISGLYYANHYKGVNADKILEIVHCCTDLYSIYDKSGIIGFISQHKLVQYIRKGNLLRLQDESWIHVSLKPRRS